jgi:lysophospholipase L1-like esterase
MTPAHFTRLRLLALSFCALSLLAPAQPAAFAAEPDHWVGTWATADVERANTKGDFAATDMTYRQIVHVSLGGSMVRVEFSNRFGTDPLTIGAAHIALAAAKGDIELPSANALAFGGHPSVIIPPGAIVVSDPVALKLPALSDLAISIFLPAQKITHITQHGAAYQTNYMAPGNVVGEKSLPAASSDATQPGTKTVANWFFLKSVEVKAPAASAAIVAFGDSITDGTASTPNTNQRWPDLLARRLQADRKTAGLGVLNLGIGGNRVLHDGTGPSALARFDPDVLDQAGVKYMIVLESINDIGHAYDLKKPYDMVSADDLIAGLTQLIERAHMHGIKVFGATLTPYFSATDPKLSASYSSAEGEAVRQAVNKWIRTGHAFDGVIDFEAATQDKATGSYIPADEHGDHLHPNDAGMKVMSDAIDLKLFTEK